jgi:hypothetical protein
MTTAKRGSFPYPVLDWTDDVTSSFEILNVTKSPSTEDIVVAFDLESNDPDLWARVDDGALRVEFRWTCNATMEAGVLESLTVRSIGPVRRSFETSLPQDRVARAIDIEVIVVAACPSPAWSWSRQHPDYAGETFEVEEGDILAQVPSFPISAKKLYDPMSGPVGACFEFVRQPSLRRGMRVDLSSDEVVRVELADRLYNDLTQLSHRPELLVSLIVLPALTDTLARLRLMADHDTVEDSAWYLSLNRMVLDRTDRAESLASEFEVLPIAQRLLEHPIDSALESLTTEEVDE